MKFFANPNEVGDLRNMIAWSLTLQIIANDLKVLVMGVCAEDFRQLNRDGEPSSVLLLQYCPEIAENSEGFPISSWLKQLSFRITTTQTYVGYNRSV